MIKLTDHPASHVIDLNSPKYYEVLSRKKRIELNLRHRSLVQFRNLYLKLVADPDNLKLQLKYKRLHMLRFADLREAIRIRLVKLAKIQPMPNINLKSLMEVS